MSWELFRQKLAIMRKISIMEQYSNYRASQFETQQAVVVLFKKSPQLVASENGKNITLFDKIHRLFSSLYYSLLTFLKIWQKYLSNRQPVKQAPKGNYFQTSRHLGTKPPKQQATKHIKSRHLSKKLQKEKPLSRRVNHALIAAKIILVLPI